MGKRKRIGKIYYNDICIATKLSIFAIKKAVKNKEFNPRDLKSIAYYIVKKTLEIPNNV